ncbi:hypothetical protein ASPTUDRAFT_736628 [Aspergillus tubingensis CBS 134.48]|uniref:Uncharacterized protein n=1 Tax=Aspergillus tubingensis (strain CBS 134.48) TaxID=767770 RepID=A0A1L9MXT9_ASPTC|nr:hypothetical protein ASPTUDRAFT_736628 [Aspergillus tubingensis CBS 134.48]
MAFYMYVYCSFFSLSHFQTLHIISYHIISIFSSGPILLLLFVTCWSLCSTAGNKSYCLHFLMAVSTHSLTCSLMYLFLTNYSQSISIGSILHGHCVYMLEKEKDEERGRRRGCERPGTAE